MNGVHLTVKPVDPSNKKAVIFSVSAQEICVGWDSKDTGDERK